VIGLCAACGTGSAGAPAASSSGSSSAPSSAPSDPAAYAADVVAATNAARADEGLPALETSACAERLAAGRARALVGTADLTHAPMDDVLRECAVDRAAENLSRASAPAADVVAAWLGSPGHRNNLLDPDVTRVGVACTPDDGRLVCSQVFLGPEEGAARP